jgi:hypothetical protein
MKERRAARKFCRAIRSTPTTARIARHQRDGNVDADITSAMTDGVDMTVL